MQIRISGWFDCFSACSVGSNKVEESTDTTTVGLLLAFKKFSFPPPFTFFCSFKLSSSDIQNRSSCRWFCPTFPLFFVIFLHLSSQLHISISPLSFLFSSQHACVQSALTPPSLPPLFTNSRAVSSSATRGHAHTREEKQTVCVADDTVSMHCISV